MIADWVYSEIDDLFSGKLTGFIPEKVFDSHAHLYRVSDLNLSEYNFINEGPDEAGIKDWKLHVGRFIKGADLCGGIFFPNVSVKCDFDRSNDYLLKQLEISPDIRGLILIPPDYSIDKIGKYLENPKIIGFKPFFYFSGEKDPGESSILNFAPEWIWEIAHYRKLMVMLHIVKSKALADKDNQDAICRMCGRYPGAKLVLAHAARGFQPQNTIEGLEVLKEFDNIWFDSSAICEARVLKAILKCFGPSRLLWGTDFPYSQIRGKCVSVGDGFAWLDNNSVNWDKLFPPCNPVLFGLESLLALKEASEELGLNENDIADIFINNAIRLIRGITGK